MVSFGFLLLFTAYGGLQSLQVRTLASERLSLGLQEAPRPRKTGTEHFSFTPSLPHPLRRPFPCAGELGPLPHPGRAAGRGV